MSRLVAMVWVHCLLTLALLPPTIQSGGRGDAIAIHGLAVGTAFAVAAITGRRGLADTPRLAFAVASGFTTLAFFGLILGSLNNAPMRYLIGDTGKLMMLPLAVLVVANLRSSDAVVSAVRWTSFVLTVQQSRDAFSIFTELLPGEVTRIHAVFWVHGTVAVGLHTYFGIRPSGLPLRLAHLTAGTGSAVVAVTYGFRTNLVLIPAAVLAAVLLQRRTLLGLSRLASFVGIALVLVIVSGALGVLAATVESPWNRITLAEELRAADDDGSAKHRAAEWVSVKDAIRDSPGSLLVGEGSGAMLSAPRGRPDLITSGFAEGERHSIHNSLATFLFRWGAVGQPQQIITVGAACHAAIRDRRSVSELGSLALLMMAPPLVASAFFPVVPGDLIYSLGVALGLSLSGRPRIDRALEAGTRHREAQVARRRL